MNINRESFVLTMQTFKLKIRKNTFLKERIIRAICLKINSLKNINKRVIGGLTLVALFEATGGFGRRTILGGTRLTLRAL